MDIHDDVRAGIEVALTDSESVILKLHESNRIKIDLDHSPVNKHFCRKLIVKYQLSLPLDSFLLLIISEIKYILFYKYILLLVWIFVFLLIYIFFVEENETSTSSKRSTLEFWTQFIFPISNQSIFPPQFFKISLRIFYIFWSPKIPSFILLQNYPACNATNNYSRKEDMGYEAREIVIVV